MSDVSLRKIASQIGVSTATVNRALRHCGGVDFETALAIRKLAREMGYTVPYQSDVPFCGIVLPEIPAYYWKAACQSLCDALEANGITMQTAVYSRLIHLESFFSALNAMLALSPKVLIIAAPKHPAVRKRLQEIATHTAVFLFGERIEGENLFYFGSDAQRDGALLAEAFCDAYPDRRQMLLVDPVKNDNYAVRTNAFFTVCTQVQVVHRIICEDFYSNSAALLARRIATEVKEPFDCAYFGTGGMPTVCLALDKLELSSDVVCVGYENPVGNARFLKSGRLGLTLCQDIVGQSEQCAQAVRDLKEHFCLPAQKYNYIDSKIISSVR